MIIVQFVEELNLPIDLLLVRRELVEKRKRLFLLLQLLRHYQFNKVQVQMINRSMKICRMSTTIPMNNSSQVNEIKMTIRRKQQ